MVKLSDFNGRELEDLSQEELQDLKNVLEFHIKTKTPSGPTATLELLFDSIKTELLKELKYEILPLTILKKKKVKTYKKLKEVDQFLIKYLEVLIGKDWNYKEYGRFTNLYTMFMVKLLKDYNIILTLDNILNMYTYFPSKLDKELPGYIKNSNFLKVLLSK
jgi:hypothetical protein